MPVTAAEVIFSDEADATRAQLHKTMGKEPKSIGKRIDYYQQRLVEDCLAGEVIRFPLPRTAKRLELTHGRLQNLYCLDLPGFWRMLYTIVRADGKPYVYVLEIVDHAGYSAYFPGRKKR